MNSMLRTAVERKFEIIGVAVGMIVEAVTS
jgi:hypothetical protein